MWLLDQWAERHIAEAQAKGEFDNLVGSGEPLILDDDSHVPPELRAGYRLLKNAGCLPPELEHRREAIQPVSYTHLIDAAVLAKLLEQQRGTIIEMFNMFSGGALSRASIFALGIMPYISASIIIQPVSYTHLDVYKRQA